MSVQTDVDEAVMRVVGRLAFVGSADIDKALVSIKSQRLSLQTDVQVAFGLRSDNALDTAVYEIVMTHAVTAERLGPGGFRSFVQRLLEIIARRRRSSQPCDREEKSRVTSGAASMAARTDDVDRVLSPIASQVDHMTSAMLREALRLAGFAGRVVVEKTHSSPSVELVRGYAFDIKRLIPVDVSLSNPRIACIDGYVEEVSELHHLLEEAAEAREPLALFVRGASDDVRHTLKVNYDRGSLKVVLYGVPFDLEGMNTLVDLAVVGGTDVVSSLKGELISGVRLPSLPRVDRLDSHRDKVIVTCVATSRDVIGHVARLRTRRADERVEDVGQLLDRRIRSLSPNHVVIRLVDDKDFVVRSQAVDRGLRAVRSLVDHGVVGPERRLAAAELGARVHAERCAVTLARLGAFVRP